MHPRYPEARIGNFHKQLMLNPIRSRGYQIYYNCVRRVTLYSSETRTVKQEYLERNDIKIVRWMFERHKAFI